MAALCRTEHPHHSCYNSYITILDLPFLAQSFMTKWKWRILTYHHSSIHRTLEISLHVPVITLYWYESAKKIDMRWTTTASQCTSVSLSRSCFWVLLWWIPNKSTLLLCLQEGFAPPEEAGNDVNEFGYDDEQEEY